MTTIQGTFRDSKGIPVSGLVRIRLDYRVLDSDSSNVFLPIAADVTLVEGFFTVDLEPSDLAKVTYLFEVIRVTPASGDQPTFETVVESFRAKIPYSVTPIDVTVLMDNTGITQDALDAAQVSIVRRLYNSEEFWNRLQQELFVHRGDWQPSTLYRRGDLTTYQGSSYLYINNIATSSQPPIIAIGSGIGTNKDYWRLMSSRGDTGTGTTGNNEPYSDVAWSNQLDAPSRNIMNNVVKTLATKTELAGKISAVDAVLTNPTLSSTPLLTDRSSLVVPSSWVQLIVDQVKKAIVPVGALLAWTTYSAPAGWVLCDGRLLDRTTYSALFAILGTTFNTGGENTTNFRVPDLRGRTPIGTDWMSSLMGNALTNTFANSGVLGAKMGAEKHTLTLAELPAHSHAINIPVSWQDGPPVTNGEYLATGLAYQSTPPAGSETGGRYRLGVSTVNAGNNQAHNNLQPSMGFTYIIYAGL